MSRTYLMSWISSKARWSKMHRGERFIVSCRQLETEPTKEASWKAANEWWTNKLVEIEARPPAPHPHQETLDLLMKRKTWAVTHGQLDEANLIAEQIAKVQKLEETDDSETEWPAVAIEVAKLFGVDVPSDLDPTAAQQIFGNGKVWQDRLQRDGTNLPPPDRTVGHLVDRWVKEQQKRVTARQLSPDRADNNRICLFHFRDFLHAGSPVDVIDANMLDKFYYHCLGRVRDPGVHTLPKRTRKRGKLAVADTSYDWSLVYAGRVFAVARSFIRYLWERHFIELPRNINSKTHAFGGGPKKVQTVTVEEVKRLVDAATGQLKLHLMLMINCGMTQTDISDLRQSEVDWKRGRITRKRSKTRHEENVPEVTYQLWPITFSLLKRYRSKDKDWVLLTMSGGRWVSKSLVDGHFHKADNVASCYMHLKKKTGIKKQLKLLRKTSASILESHSNYGRYKHHFLGHSPRSIADKHYAAPSDTLFDEIIRWLGEQYGFG
ncbi:site-specific integrase [bacterium]|nr:site-specific integrase [bacterium]